jgi:hypothetical protein
MLIWGNDDNGVDINGNATESGGVVTPAVIPHGVQAFNITSAYNANRNFRYDEDPTTSSPPSTHILRNSISYSGSNTFDSGNTSDHNTFDGPGGSPAGLGVSESDFVSTADPVMTSGSYHPAGSGGDRSGITTPVYATGPAVALRQADGSLPSIDFFRLAAGSHLIDAGMDVGIPFNGLAPDIGWVEFIAPGPALPGDYNGDNIVNAADYTVWRNNLNSSATLPNDETPGSVDDDDYGVWKAHFGESLPGSGSAALSPVPEPSIVAVLTAAMLVGGCLRKSLVRRIAVHGRG